MYYIIMLISVQLVNSCKNIKYFYTEVFRGNVWNGKEKNIITDTLTTKIKT